MAGHAATAAAKDQSNSSGSQSKAEEEILKLLKRLGYPETQEPAHAVSLLPKAITSAMKRISKLESLSEDLAASARTSDLAAKSLV